MKKSLCVNLACIGSLFGILLTVSACGSRPSAAQIQTAVAGTLALATVQPAEPQQVVEVTQVIEVTKIIEVEVTSAPRPTERATATATAQPEATEAATPTTEAGAAATPESTQTARPVEATGPLGLTFNQLMRNYAGMTDLQKQDYVATLPGKLVEWTGQVNNITAEGVLILDNPYGKGRVTLIGVPVETSIKIDPGMLVDFSGMIASFKGTYFIEIDVVDAEVIRYYPPPTGTLTAN